MKKASILSLLLLCTLCAVAQQPAQPDLRTFLPIDQPIEAVGYDSHVELRWAAVKGADHYVVYLLHGSERILRGETPNLYYLDFIKDQGLNATYTYRVAALDAKGKQLAETPSISATVSDFDDVQLQRMVQQYTFRYFWDFADPLTGLTYERSNDTRESCITTGGTGFGIMGIVAAVESGFVERPLAVARLAKMVDALGNLPRFHGAWAHWYNSRTGEPYHFSDKDNGGDLVETAFLVEGLLAAKGYFNGSDPAEKALNEKIEKLWREVEWNHYTQGQEALYWHWSPDFGFAMNHKIKGYDETFITYILAAASPTYPIDKAVYDNCWVNHKEGEFFCATDFYGIMLPLGKRSQMGGPLFWVHYSYIGLDPRGLADLYADYWQQNRRYTLVNRAYCMDNPYNWVGYGPDFWGLTASDALPSGYRAHAPGVGHDFGTIAPTAALSSMPYTPQESITVLKNLYRNYGSVAFGIMGFYDAINLSQGEPKSTQSYLAIDQGPILGMIENHLKGTVWQAFMSNNDVLRGLDKLGFTIYHKPIQYVK